MEFAQFASREIESDSKAIQKRFESDWKAIRMRFSANQTDGSKKANLLPNLILL
jgi:hypothetical protein